MSSELHPQAQAFLERMEQKGGLPSHALSVEGARESLNELLITDKAEPVGEVKDLSVPGPTEEGVPIRIYIPEGSGPFPVLVYFHGGGWVKGNLETHDDLCRSLTNDIGVVTVSVDYRRPPEYPFPAGLEDSYAVTRWVTQYADAFDGDPDAVAVGGESAGGNLAAAVSLLARDRGEPSIDHQILLYPVLDRDLERRSYEEKGEDYNLTTSSMRWYWNHYLLNEVDAKNPYAAPLQARNLSDLPRATVVTCGFDPLHDEGVLYAECLDAADVPVQLLDYEDQIHGFISFPEHMDQALELRKELATELHDTFDMEP
jgi:acetyl esterase